MGLLFLILFLIIDTKYIFNIIIHEKFLFVHVKYRDLIQKWGKRKKVFAKQESSEILSFDDLHQDTNFPIEWIFTFKKIR